MIIIKINIEIPIDSIPLLFFLLWHNKYNMFARNII